MQMYVNNTAYSSGRSCHALFKLFIAMKLCFMLIILGFVQVKAAVFGQSASLNLKNAPITKVFTELKRQTEYDFLYLLEDLQGVKPVTISLKDAPIETILDACFDGQPLSYSIRNATILVRRKVILNTERMAKLQDKVIKGMVLTESGEPLPGVSVMAKGTRIGTRTNNEGSFSIAVPQNTTTILTFSMIGYVFQEISVEDQLTLTVTMKEDEQALGEVVVTAFGVRKERKGLVYSAPEVKGEEFIQARDNNIASALTGKIAGVDATQINAGPGSSSRVIIRGNNSLSGSNPNQQPLYVVNGLPINNSNSGASQNTTGLNVDRGDGISMINPDDIETISVLKGGAAAALYGSQAANGVVLITTKSGKAQENIGIEFNSVATVGRPTAYPNYQYEYGQGQNGTFPTTAAQAQASGRLSYGARVDPSIQYMQVDGQLHPYAPVNVKDNINEFYRSSSDFTNNIAFNAGSEKLNGRLSLSDLRSNSMQPNSTYDRQTANLSLMTKLGKNDLLVIKSDVQYNIVNGKNRPTVGYAEMNAAWPVYLIANTVDIKNLAPGYNPDTGVELPWNPVPEAPNPYFIVNRMGNDDQTKRYIASTSIQLNLSDNLFLMGRAQRDYQYYERSDFAPIGKNSQPFGALNTSNGNEEITNIQGTVNYNNTFSQDWGISAMAGVNRERASFVVNNLNGINFVVPDFISLTNLSTITTTATSDPPYHREIRTGTNSVFASADFDYKRAIFLSFTGRNDWFSTLNPGSNSIFYPSIGTAVVLSDLMKMPEKIDFFKLRGSWAQVGSATVNAGQVNQIYTISTTNAYNIPSQIVSEALPSPDLRPLTVTTSEGGFEAQFFKNRLGLDFTYYSKVTSNDIVSVNISSASGFTGGNVNIGKVTNKGIETLITGNPIQSNGFRWDVTFNYAYNKSRIVELAPTVAEISLGSGIGGIRVVNRPGLPYGTLMVMQAMTTADGTPVYNSTSNLPVQEEVAYGVGVPPHTMGLGNNFRYKDLSLDILLDGKFGAVGYNNLMQYATRFGLTPMTLEGRDTGLQLEGVDQNGNPYNYLWTPDNIQSYYNQIGIQSTALFTYKTDFVKLRRLVLSYHIPVHKLNFMKVQAASLSLVGNNLLILYRDKQVKEAGLDPEFQESVSNAQGTGGVNMPRARTFGLNLMVKF